MKYYTDKLCEIEFPDIDLSKLDKCDEYGYKYEYHWEETKDKLKRHIQSCVFLKEDNDYKYYLALNDPYEIYRKHNCPEQHKDEFYVVSSGETEYKILNKVVPDNIFMPTLEYCNSITPSEWFDVFTNIVTNFPEEINYIAKFSFLVVSDNPLYDGYYLVCYPFVNMSRDDNGNICYKKEWCWAVEDTHSIKINDEYVNHTGNVYFYEKNYTEDWFNRSLLPVIKIKKD